MNCYDKMSGEHFTIAGVAIVSEIEQRLADGIDHDSGAIAYDVDTDDGGNYRGQIDPGEWVQCDETN